jgi:hypothetical protein
MIWSLSWRADPRAKILADRHYNRQNPESAQFVPPGRCLVLLSADATAFWVTSYPFAEHVKHAWAGAWMCSAFRNEGPALSSELIRQAVAVTRWRWPEIPARGMVTFVDPDKTTAGRSRRAGFREVGRTKEEGLLALQLMACDMPPPPIGSRRVPSLALRRCLT